MVNFFDLILYGFYSMTEYYQYILDNRFKLPQDSINNLVGNLSPEQKEAFRTHVNESLCFQAIDNNTEDKPNDDVTDWYKLIGV